MEVVPCTKRQHLALPPSPENEGCSHGEPETDYGSARSSAGAEIKTSSEMAAESATTKAELVDSATIPSLPAVHHPHAIIANPVQVCWSTDIIHAIFAVLQHRYTCCITQHHCQSCAGVL